MTDDTPADAAMAQLAIAIKELDEPEGTVFADILQVAEKCAVVPSRVTTMLSETMLNFVFPSDGDESTVAVMALDSAEFEWWGTASDLLKKLPITGQLRVCAVLLLSTSYTDLLADKAEAFYQATQVDGDTLN